MKHSPVEPHPRVIDRIAQHSSGHLDASFVECLCQCHGTTTRTPRVGVNVDRRLGSAVTEDELGQRIKVRVPRLRVNQTVRVEGQLIPQLTPEFLHPAFTRRVLREAHDADVELAKHCTTP